MNKWVKGLLVSVLSAVLMLVAFSQTTYAAATSEYLIKAEDGTVYTYNVGKLEESFVNNQYGGGDDTLYLDFKNKLANNGFYAFKSEAGLFVDYKVIESAYLENTAEFNLPDFMSSDDAKKVSDLPSTITEISVDNGEIAESEVETGEEDEEAVVPEVVDIY